MAFPGHINISKFDGKHPDSWIAYSCGHCGAKGPGAVVAAYGAKTESNVRWIMCVNCLDGSVMSRDKTVYPSTPFGPKIEELPSEVEKAYLEARSCLSVNAATACELICRKILMHIAVEKGAA